MDRAIFSVSELRQDTPLPRRLREQIGEVAVIGRRRPNGPTEPAPDTADKWKSWRKGLDRKPRRPVSAPQPLGSFPERRHESGVRLPDLPPRSLGRSMEARSGRLLALARPRLLTLVKDRGHSERKDSRAGPKGGRSEVLRSRG